jgi:hypothetical protein
VLAQPLIVEAIEEYFVPVAVYNNAGGKDKKVLNQFGEPAWNYQVMRFLDPQLKDIIPRRDKIWSRHATARRLSTAIKASGQEVPRFLTNVVIPESNPDNQIAVFAMYCFWTGEAKLGSLDGVIATEAGFYDGKEVVVVKYDDQTIKLLDLVRAAEKFDCAHGVYLPTKRSQRMIADQTRLKNVALFSFQDGYRRAPQNDQKKQLASNKNLKSLNLTPMQWTKLNARGFSKDSPKKWLSPRQIKKLAN